MNLQQLRDYVRTQIDVDEEELPNEQLDAYVAEAFVRTISMETRWPFYETRWPVGLIDGDDGIALPADCDPVGIDSLIDESNGARLVQIAIELGEDRFVGPNAIGDTAFYYSILGNKIVLWPSPPTGHSPRSFRLRGHRYAQDWMIGGAGAVPDCDVRLHILFAHYAIALAYAQQEDEVLEDVYMKRWQSSYMAAHSAICSPRHHRPLVFNGGTPALPSGNPVVWSDPPVAP